MSRPDSAPACAGRASAPRTCVYVMALCIVGLLPAPRAAFALELGAIEARSLLYEPLDARIALHDAGSADRRGLTVTLGTPAQFELAGVARGGCPEAAPIRRCRGERRRRPRPGVDRRAHHRAVLTFLVSAEWARGRTIRGYHLTLDAGAAGVASPSAEAPAPTSGGTGPSSAERGAGSTRDRRAVRNERNDVRPVRRSETLWSIASRVRPDTSISVQRMMLALLEANPGAFAFSNVNALNAGTTLRIPTLDELGPRIRRRRLRRCGASIRRGSGAAPTGARPPPPPPRRLLRAMPRPQPGGRIELVAPESEPDEASPTRRRRTNAPPPRRCAPSSRWQRRRRMPDGARATSSSCGWLKPNTTSGS